jgi:3-isopropylmalate/(R)-2-methylmalate dehydratase small subunit
MPEPIRQVTGIAAALPIENVDTDMIWPGSTGESISKGEQADHAFRHMRFTPDGVERPDFILNRKPWRDARILVAGDNFGCGSSRELAVWALYDWGLRCIIAPRFGDIFYTNCCLNGLLPIRLARGEVDRLSELAADPATASMTVDLESCTVTARGDVFTFIIESRARLSLLNGHDAISQTLAEIEEVRSFGHSYRQKFIWMPDLPDQF